MKDSLLMLFSLLLFGCNSVKNSGLRIVKTENGFVPFNDPHLQYEGRIGIKNKEAAVLYWSGSIVRIRFKGTGLRALLKDYNGQNFFQIIVDGTPVRKIRIDSTQKWYTVAEKLTDGQHEVELFKRTQINKEYNRGYTMFYGFDVNNGSILPAPAPRKRKIEFYGNSITCGHAVEDTSGADSGAAVFENNYLSYAALTARHYQAQYTCIAVSGIGLIAGFRKYTMPEIYNLRNPFDSTDRYQFSEDAFRVVVVNLLQNDEAVMSRPDHQQFKKLFGDKAPTDDTIVAAYKNFIQKLRVHYPTASIICTLGSMGITRQGSKWPRLVALAVSELKDPKIFTHFFPFKGTAGHPNVKEQEDMANSLIRFIDTNIKW